MDAAREARDNSPMNARLVLALASVSSLLLLTAGCSGDAASSSDGDMASAPPPADLAGAPDDFAALPPSPDLATAPARDAAGTNPLVTMRPYPSKVPANYDPARAWPLVILLHGYSASGALQDL